MDEKQRKKLHTFKQKKKSVQDKKDAEPKQWSQLPDTIIMEIYMNLGDVDRVSMARVCKTWYQVFHVPSLWRSREIDFGLRRANLEAFDKAKKESPVSNGKHAIKFVKQFPTSLEDIAIRFRFMSEQPTKQMINDFKELCASLDGAKLRNISIWNLNVDTVSGQKRKDVIDSLKRLLRDQSSIRKFKEDASFYDLESGLEILRCLADASASTIQDLSLKDLVLNGVYMYRDGRVSAELKKFTGLSRIDFDYNLISEELVKTWVTTCPKLTFIKLCANDYVHPNHVISCEAWKSLVGTHPNLLVEFESSEIPDLKQMNDILSPAIPLFELSWYTFQNTSEFELTRLLNRVAHYHRTVKHLCLRLSGQFPNLNTTAVQNILSKCSHLLPFKCVTKSKRKTFTGKKAWGLVQETSWLTENDI
ncbi:unnamed protein product [Lymnaea stagnalis]|uniref:F-box domain-containing protein n=1 Tax=Lymnaea stagnalis TaxID=6523 RepID=A0AAV2HKL8_LYMST